MLVRWLLGVIGAVAIWTVGLDPPAALGVAVPRLEFRTPAMVETGRAVDLVGRVVGTVGNAATVLLERSSRGRWEVESREALPSSRRFSLWLHPQRPGTVFLRVRLSNGRQAVLSDARHVLVASRRQSANPKVRKAPSPAQAKAAAARRWRQEGRAILRSFVSGESAGQCTDYVTQKRPDVVQHVFEWEWTQQLLKAHPSHVPGWDAEYWGADAALAGLPLSHTPSLNAIMVFQPGDHGAGSIGHVAIVTTINPDGSFIITQMHAPVLGELSTRDFAATEAVELASDPGIIFIP